MYLTVIPAYGRDYKSQKEVKAAFAAGHDFMIQDMSHPNDGAYINKSDATKGMTLNIRYKQKTQVLPIKVS